MGVRRVHDVLQRAPWIVYPDDDPRVTVVIQEHVDASDVPSMSLSHETETTRLCAAACLHNTDHGAHSDQDASP